MFSEFEKNVFRRREHEQFFRDGKIKSFAILMVSAGALCMMMEKQL